VISIEKIYSITIKDMRLWFRQPYLIFIAVAPLLVIGIATGVFMTSAESLPAGIIIDDSDPKALELKEHLITMKSGTGLNWFAIDEDDSKEEVLDKYEQGKILCYITIPINLTGRLEVGEIVPIQITINNINDDITKNAMQRLEEACNHINANLAVDSVTATIPTLEFESLTEADLTFSHYMIAGVLSLAVLLSSGVNIATTTAREFEEGTIKELLMGSSSVDVVLGKLMVAILQTLICWVILSGIIFVVFGFIPQADFLIVFLMIIWGSLCFSSLGFIFAAKIKDTIPAAIVVLVLNIGGWYIGGGLVPGEVWIGIINIFSTYWPGTYFFRQFVQLMLVGTLNYELLLVDLVITGAFGVLTIFIASYLFIKEAKHAN
jgi:hypothetical protein